MRRTAMLSVIAGPHSETTTSGLVTRCSF